MTSARILPFCRPRRDQKPIDCTITFLRAQAAPVVPLTFASDSSAINDDLDPTPAAPLLRAAA